MSNFSLGFKTQIINTNTQNVARFFKLKTGGAGYEFLGTSDDFVGDATDDQTDAYLLANADRVVIDGFVTLDKGKVKNAIGAKGVPAQKPEIVLTFGTNTPTALQEFTLALTIKSFIYDSEFARPDSDYERTFFYPLIVKAGDTPATVIARFENALTEEKFEERPYIKVVSKTTTTITLTTESSGHEIVAKASGEAVSAGKVTVSSAVSKVGYEGRNNYEILKNYRMETEATLQPFNVNDIKRQGLPIPGALYTSITLSKDFTRDELSGSTMVNQTISGDAAFELYINQDLTKYILALTSWINANVANREYYAATTPALATASPEVVAKYTAVAAAPYTTGLN